MQRSNKPKRQGTTGSRRAASRPVKNANSSSNDSRRSLRDYAPVAYSKAIGPSRAPTFASVSGGTRVGHTEFFNTVRSAGTPFAVQSFPLNPGMASIFPWLSQVAQRYETYKFRHISFKYHTRCATTAVGTVGMVFDFDAQDPPPASEMDALSYHDKVADSPWKESTLILDLASGDKLPTRYVRAGQLPTAYDLKTLDLGALHIFTDGVATNASVGLCEVKYTVDLFTPQIQNPVGGSFTSTLGLSGANLLGDDLTPDASSIAPAYQVGKTGTMYFDQACDLLMVCTITGTGVVPDFHPVVANGSASLMHYLASSTGTVAICVWRVSATPGTTVSPTCTATTITNVKWEFARAAYSSLN